MNTVSFEGKVVTPLKIICVGRNYVEHIAELGNEIPESMVVFSKPNSAISNVLKAVHHEPLHYEAELCFMIENDGLAGVGCGLDLTKRALQTKLKKQGLPWERAKGFDGAALFSPFVRLPKNRDNLMIELDVNGNLRQRGTIDKMMYKPDQILKELQEFMTLVDGDIIMTGTPAGVGEVVAGATYACRVLLADQVITQTSWVAE